MEDVATPSINAQMMPSYVGRRVRLVCELDGPGDGQTLTARTSDKGNVLILKDPRAGIPTTRYVEFIGTVEDGGRLREESNSTWGENFGERLLGSMPACLHAAFSSSCAALLRGSCHQLDRLAGHAVLATDSWPLVVTQRQPLPPVVDPSQT